jgi:hypothetical protein
VIELFIFVFDVTLTLEMQELSHDKSLESAALRELTRLPPHVQEAFHMVFGNPSLPAIRSFATEHQLQHLLKALTDMKSEQRHSQLLQTCRQVLALLAERQSRARKRTPVDLETFLHLPDWQNLPVDSRLLFQELVRTQEKSERRAG